MEDILDYALNGKLELATGGEKLKEPFSIQGAEIPKRITPNELLFYSKVIGKTSPVCKSKLYSVVNQTRLTQWWEKIKLYSPLIRHIEDLHHRQMKSFPR